LISCGGRTGGIGGFGDGGSILPDAGSVPPKCTSLSSVANVALDYSDALKMAPRVVFDGTRFVASWHSQSPVTSSMNGDLNLSWISLAGAASHKNGLSLGKNNGYLQHSLLAEPGGLALLNAVGSVVHRRLLDGQGKTTHTATFKEAWSHVDLAPFSGGHAIIAAENKGNPRLLTMSKAGDVKERESLITAQIMARVSLAQRPGGGYAALLHTTNTNGTLYLLSNELKTQAMGNMGHGAQLRSVSLATFAQQAAAAYIASHNRAELEIYRSNGASARRVALGKTPTGLPLIDQTALVHTGEQLVAVYPSTVAGQFRLRLAEVDGKLTGNEMKLPLCMGVASSQTDAAWGNGHLAVATVNHGSGVARSAVCITLMKCQ